MSLRSALALCTAAATMTGTAIACARDSDIAAMATSTPTAVSTGSLSSVVGDGAVVDPTPTMSPKVEELASTCWDMYTIAEVEPGRIVGANYAFGEWTVEVEGLWQEGGWRAESRSMSTPVPSFIARCTRIVRDDGTLVTSSGGPEITATPEPGSAPAASVPAILGDEEPRSASEPNPSPSPSSIDGWFLYDLGPPLPPVVAEVRVAEILPVRSNTESGVVPTRDPALPYMKDVPTTEKYLYAPVLLEVTDWIHGSPGAVPSVLITAYAGYAADIEQPLEPGIPAPVLDGLSVGDEAIAYLAPLSGSTGWPKDDYLVEEASRRTTSGSPTLAAVIDVWYYYDGDNAIRLGSGSTITIQDLKDLIDSKLSE